MGRLNLVIADHDEDYVKSFSDFLTYKYSNRFQISYFTKYDCLLDFIENEGKKVDILLLDIDMYAEDMPFDKVGTVIILTGGNQLVKNTEHKQINKYQHGDRIVGDIIEAYSMEDRGINQRIYTNKNKTTRIVTFFSPAGGSGTTCVALGSSVQCAMRGMTVLYLDFQTLNSTKLFFEFSKTRGLSDILYSLKEKETDIAAKIEALRCVDEEYNIHFFAPAQSGVELWEVTPEEYAAFIRQIRNMGYYDVIFIDSSADFALRNAEILETSDRVFIIVRQDTLSAKKAKVLLDEMNILEQRKGVNLKDGVRIIINNCNGSPADMVTGLTIEEKAPAFILPYSPEISAIRELKTLADMEDDFNKGINVILNKGILESVR
ncbi:MAG TPA: AAA family ATPase [Clostridiaceae bacterium]|nr:AAA family ATPase [Clostridiaceae bacterium]